MSGLSVLHVAQPCEGGVARYVLDVCRDQLARGWEVVVACPDGGRLAGELRDAGIARLRWDAVRRPGPESIEEARRLRALAARVRPDVVHLHSAKAGFAGRMDPRGLGRPGHRPAVLFQPHGWSWLAVDGATRRGSVAWERAAARRTDLLVCVGETEQEAGRAQGIGGRYVVVPNGVDLRRFHEADAAARAAARHRLGVPAGPLAVCVGRLTRQKGQDVLLSAWPAVRSRCPAARLALVGGGDLLPSLRATGEPGVLFTGEVDDVRDWLAAADVVVLPSRWEGLSLAALEALATGRPVVASDVPGLAEVVVAGAGARVPAQDPAALAGAVLARLTDPARAAAEGRAAARHAATFDQRATFAGLAAATTEAASAARPAARRRESTDLADPAFWARPHDERLDAFRRLREREAPVWFPERSGGGFHALVRHADVVYASRHPELFISGTGVTTPRPPGWVRRAFGDSMVNLDDPRHARLRGVVSRSFTPRVLARIAADVDATAARIVDDVLDRRPDDFVASVAGRMPMEVICSMMGIPERDRRGLLDRVDDMIAGTGARRRLRVPGRSLAGLARLHQVMARVARQRRRDPADDLISALVTAEVDGRRLDARELGAFFSLLLVAGVETTRNAIAHGLHLLTAHPGQRALLAADPGRYGAGFVDEVVRHSSPIRQFRRTVAADCELRGHPLRSGDDVVLFYVSANRDETTFTDPDRFDLTRRPNPHVGFGGGGPHFCLGSSLARQEMTVLFRELLTRLPEIRSVREPDLVPSSFDNRVRRLEFAF